YDKSVWDKTAGFTEGFTALMRELTGLAREFAGAEIRPLLGADDLFQAEVYLGGEWTCITVNLLERPNGLLAPLEVVREPGRCPRPAPKSVAYEGLLPPNRKPAAAPRY